MSIDIVPEINSHYPRSNEHSVVNNDIDIVTESLASTVLNPDIIDAFGKNDTSMQHKNLDLNHKVHSARQILKPLWSEPSGDSAEDEAISSRSKENSVMISANFRRFAIIGFGQGDCLCKFDALLFTDCQIRSIITYGRRATDKPGVHAEEHIIICEMKPALAPNESLAK
ncbi:hypothetical protein BOTNAR_0451g00030 [Botryotinia narcissicola]|uniref:DUF6590 domain-containing protein n=1 Tax=Botryotinia narcissicola TaxID=278944 RepID=A0A4Z1HIU1_9HELO|nr:hypothetical protein BOTNAR_0451g00030 [Botryotinia narcissicola]